MRDGNTVEASRSRPLDPDSSASPASASTVTATSTRSTGSSRRRAPAWDVGALGRALAGLRAGPALCQPLVRGGQGEVDRRQGGDAHLAFLEELLEAVALGGAAGQERREELAKRHAP